jgi:hypothetical protein
MDTNCILSDIPKPKHKPFNPNKKEKNYQEHKQVELNIDAEKTIYSLNKWNTFNNESVTFNKLLRQLKDTDYLFFKSEFYNLFSSIDKNNANISYSYKFIKMMDYRENLDFKSNVVNLIDSLSTAVNSDFYQQYLKENLIDERIIDYVFKTTDYNKYSEFFNMDELRNTKYQIDTLKAFARGDYQIDFSLNEILFNAELNVYNPVSQYNYNKITFNFHLHSIIEFDSSVNLSDLDKEVINAYFDILHFATQLFYKFRFRNNLIIGLVKPKNKREKKLFKIYLQKLEYMKNKKEAREPKQQSFNIFENKNKIVDMSKLQNETKPKPLPQILGFKIRKISELTKNSYLDQSDSEKSKVIISSGLFSELKKYLKCFDNKLSDKDNYYLYSFDIGTTLKVEHITKNGFSVVGITQKHSKKKSVYRVKPKQKITKSESYDLLQIKEKITNELLKVEQLLFHNKLGKFNYKKLKSGLKSKLKEWINQLNISGSKLLKEIYFFLNKKLLFFKFSFESDTKGAIHELMRVLTRNRNYYRYLIQKRDKYLNRLE